jgi:glycosyltransferase involved in cell wall biosynthesis
VLAQDYPRIEYLVMDGGSTDGTLEILEKYRGRLRYCSGKDEGQGDAVNRGFALTTGSIFAFLNADDTYLAGAISSAVQLLQERPKVGLVYGEAYHVGVEGQILKRYPTEEFDPERFRRRCYICQPAAFMRRTAFEAAGMLNPRLRFALDYDLWIRMARCCPMLKSDEFWATSRLHSNSKTIANARAVFREVFTVLRQHYDYVPSNWLYGYCSYLLTGRHPVPDPPAPSVAKTGLCLVLGAWYNWKHLPRYASDMFSTARETLTWPPAL